MQLRSGLLNCIQHLASALDGGQNLIETLARIAGKVPRALPASAAVLECLTAAASALSSYPSLVSYPSSPHPTPPHPTHLKVMPHFPIASFAFRSTCAVAE